MEPPALKCYGMIWQKYNVAMYELWNNACVSKHNKCAHIYIYIK